jgi:hypothetical protein
MLEWCRIAAPANQAAAWLEVVGQAGRLEGDPVDRPGGSTGLIGPVDRAGR